MLAPWKKSYDQPRQHIKKQRYYYTNKGPSSQSYGFSVTICGCESWTIKKAEHQRIDAFELSCWRTLLRVPCTARKSSSISSLTPFLSLLLSFLRAPWTARRSNQTILKEISPEYSLEGLMLKLKLQYFGHLIQRTDSFENTLMLGKIEGKGRRE